MSSRVLAQLVTQEGLRSSLDDKAGIPHPFSHLQCIHTTTLYLAKERLSEHFESTASFNVCIYQHCSSMSLNSI